VALPCSEEYKSVYEQSSVEKRLSTLFLPSENMLKLWLSGYSDDGSIHQQKKPTTPDTK
jgi:hypothetical protein